MIIGQNQIEVGNNDVIYDYSACLYPEGYINAIPICLIMSRLTACIMLDVKMKH